MIPDALPLEWAIQFLASGLLVGIVAALLAALTRVRG